MVRRKKSRRTRGPELSTEALDHGVRGSAFALRLRWQDRRYLCVQSVQIVGMAGDLVRHTVVLDHDGELSVAALERLLKVCGSDDKEPG